MLSLNVAPYFDDFDPEKNYHKILFVPGNPVQARELTQIQSILQHQIKMHGDHIFKNGDMVIPGNVYFDSKVTAIKLKKLFNAADVNNVLESLVGKPVISNVSQIKAQVVWFEKGTETTNPYIFIKYITGGDTGATKFSKDEILNYDGNDVVEIDSADGFSTPGAICYISQGVFYINGYFVGIDNQAVTVTTALSESTNCSIGLQLVEQIVTAADDSTLYDNAQGYSNFSAPGADRYKIGLQLVKTDYSESFDTQSFIKLLDIVDGQIAYLNNRTQYSHINKMLARRTYDESGDFVVTEPKNIRISARHKRKNYNGDWVSGTFYMKGDYVTYTGADNIQRVYYTVDTGVSGVIPPTHTYGKVSDGVLNWTQVEANYVKTNNGAYFPSDAATATQYNNELNVIVSPLKAYVKGFEVETQTTKFTVDKTLTTKTKTDNIQVPIGQYVLIDTISGTGTLDTTTIQKGTIKDSANATIGTCWIRNLEYAEGTSYRLYIFDIKMNPGKTFTDHAQKIAVGTTFTCNIVLQNLALTGLVSATGTTTVTGKMTRFTSELAVGSSIVIGTSTYVVSAIASDSSLTCTGSVTAVTDTAAIAKYAQYVNKTNNYLIQLPSMRLHSFRDTRNTLSMEYTICQYKALGTAAGGSVSYPLSGNDYFVSGGKHILFKTDGTTSVVTDATFSYSNNNKTLTISNLVNGKTYSGIFIVKRIADPTKEKTKILKTKTIILDNAKIYNAQTGAQISSSYNFRSTKFPLTEADVVRIISIKMSGTPGDQYVEENEIDVSSKFICHSNTTSEFYGMPIIERRPNTSAMTAPLKVTFEYFDHSSGDFCSKNSYNDVLDAMIPSIYGGATTLADTLDFRSRMDDTGAGWNTSNGAVVSTPLLSGSSIVATYTYYLPRLDVISLSMNGTVIYTKGKPSDWNGLTFPPIDSNQLILAQVFVAPNVTNLPADYSYKLMKYRRYTMRDIGKLDDRLTNVEQYVTLSMLEKSAADMMIKDENGMNRFKNGVIVDNFTSTAVADIASPDFKADLNTVMLPNTLSNVQYTDHVKLVELDSSAAGRAQSKYQVTGTVATLPYTVKSAIVQTVASTPEYINPFNVVVFEGVMTVTPPEDIWTVETLTQRTVYV